MGQRGPAKTPKAVLKLHGTYREDRHGGPDVPAEAPSCPSWLSTEAKAEWKRITPTLVRLVGVARIDRAILATYCETWAEYHAAVKAVREEGETYKTHTQNGTSIRRHPMVEVRNQARRDLVKLASQLGLSPSARTGLQIERLDEPQSAEERFLA